MHLHARNRYRAVVILREEDLRPLLATKVSGCVKSAYSQLLLKDRILSNTSVEGAYLAAN